VPAAALLVSPFRWRNYLRLTAKAAILAAAITIPFALWNVKAFVHDVVWFQIAQPFREDALSYLPWIFGERRYSLGWLCFLAAVPAAAFGVWRGSRSPSGFAAATALTLFVFFALGKQAFCNYYYLVLGACCAALAVGANPRTIVRTSDTVVAGT
jgi:hypothetical protein